MKKKMIALLAGALMMLGASSAFAAISSTSFELYRVVYDSSTNSTFECLSDLGSFSTANNTLLPGSVVGSGTNAFTSATGYSTAISNGADMKISYFAFDTATSSLYAGFTGETATPVDGSSNWGSAGAYLKTAVTTAYKTAAGTGSATTAVLSGGTTNSNSFAKKISKTGSFGNYFSDASVWPLTAVSLATLASNQTTHLYLFSGDSGATGTLQLSLTTDKTTGATTIVPNAATPIPAAIYLMGSGLLGMVGLRRKQRR